MPGPKQPLPSHVDAIVRLLREREGARAEEENLLPPASKTRFRFLQDLIAALKAGVR